KTPDKFQRLGAQVPKGVLLIGPPGTGKTLLARAVAGEANVPFYAINGSEFIQMFVGVGASRVRDMFKTAKENSPCLLFIDDVDLEGIAKKMIGMTGADLRNLANEAALLATRDNKNKVGKNDFEQAADRVLRGPKREEILTPEGKRRTAYHEAGHALLCWLDPAADKPIKVSIIPRGMTLGVNLSVPEEERYFHGLQYFKSR